MESLFPGDEGRFAAIAETLRGAEKVSVVAHVKPDADAVGSACGLAAGLRGMGIQADVFIGQTYPHAENLRTVPGVGEITYGATLPADGLVVTVDCASIDRTGLLQEAIAANPERVIVIDHHETNPGFGGTNLIIDSESTTTLVRELFRHLGVALTEEIAYCLYAGLVTDTGSFRWGTPRMHVLAAELMTYGLNTRQIALDLMDSMSALDLRIMGSVLADMQTFREKGLTVSVIAIPAEALARMSQTAVESIIEYARALQGSDVGVVFKQQAPRYWAVSLRSSVIDVSQVAAALGGGGHIPAAGYSATGTLDMVTRELLAALPE
ncbi:bifunctional oligoribonuclease/PAP phosphatase NrnA [Corynebacterium aquatimens]|uniref:DHH family phosphoesterase n=1 Tax=Corynebacterium TaxID=1716 RepID=UPI001F2C0891|nr:MULTISPECIES: bifunctional oligoribonuclease/PAP phosphatase NrnA [Corynebacterium]QYH19574.1 bifunctional oligoribonuclease/PAP phosphatase NrnA [Corynebacterium aquatimens]UIZ91459.1 bifunctional oligoribonuclease/PAP phosphatase NrnA [Corynebacterium sp. CNCTC7651]